ncbi:MAG TPA: amino acid permease, partial [Acidobacteriota bacterium]|nr:amino acid permease [Acidobacteriota bacterium]
MNTTSSQTSSPLPSFTVFGSMAIVIGIVIGVGIFRLPPLIAMNSTGELQFILFWVVGGFISLMGALCYAELSSAMPNAGGEYYFLRKAYGPGTGFLLSWGRMTVIQTGSLAIIAFILGDFATIILDLGSYSASIYAASAIILLTALNILGTLHSSRVQSVLALLIVVTLTAVIAGGLFARGSDIHGLTLHLSQAPVFSGGISGLAMIFVLLTFGGWSEAAYITGEMRNVRKTVVRALVFGILIITALYVLVNLAYLRVLGFEGLKASETVGHDLAEIIFGPFGSILVVAIVLIAALSTANATIITGARTNYAIGRDFRMFRFMGAWNEARNTPVVALLVQGAIALLLVGIGARSKQAIQTMVDFTAPVFWFFIVLTTVSIFIFRYRDKESSGGYRVPLFPAPPVLFLLAGCYMLYNSV